MPIYRASTASHTHVESDVTSLTTDLSALQASTFAPADHGYLAWTCDTQNAGSSQILATAGVLYGVKIKLAAAATISTISCRVTANGATLTNSFLGLHDSTGTRVGVTANQSSVWTSSGPYAISLVTPYAAAAGTYYVTVLCGSAGTLPTFSRNANSAILNDGLSAGSFRAWSSGTGQTSIPSSVTLGSTAAINQNFWFGLS